MRRRAGWAVICLPLSTLAACADDPERTLSARLSLVETLAGSDTAGYERAVEARPFRFPADHGPHPSFRTEWWYVTGNLSADGGRDFGFQFTLFRSALAPERPETLSTWSTNQAYMGHFTVTDVAQRRFYVHERFARGAAELAGARGSPLKVWLEDWVLESRGTGTFPVTLEAADESVHLRLDLEAGKPAVFQGEQGLSRKGPEEGNASYYYSHTRMPARGTLVVASDTLEVAGQAWMDREWSTSALPEGVVGWDWFALQLDDGFDLMIYQLRHGDGTAHPQSDGVLVTPEGERVPLEWGTDVTMESTGTWTSPVDGARYPSGWRIAVPGRGWALTVEPRLPDQELDVAFRYWEGAVRVGGEGDGGRPVQGLGYVELTGYAGEPPER